MIERFVSWAPIRLRIQMSKMAIPTSSQKFALVVGHGLDHVFPIAGVKEELPTFRIRYELNEVCVSTDRKQKIKLVHAEHSS